MSSPKFSVYTLPELPGKIVVELRPDGWKPPSHPEPNMVFYCSAKDGLELADAIKQHSRHVLNERPRPSPDAR